MKLAQIDFEALEGSQADVGFNFAGAGLGEIVSQLIPYFLTFAGILLLLYLLFGGLQLMLSRGDPKAMQDAKGKITNALVGFIIVFTAYWLVQLVGQLLGLESSTFGELF
jgi:hypothetical protein